MAAAISLYLDEIAWIIVMCILVVTISIALIASDRTHLPTSLAPTPTPTKTLIPTFTPTPIPSTSTPVPPISVPDLEIGEIIFVARRTADNLPSIPLNKPLNVFPRGATDIVALIFYTATTDIELQVTWYQNGIETGSSSQVTKVGGNTRIIAYLGDQAGFIDGNIEIRVRREGKLIASNVITIGHRPTIYPIEICESIDISSKKWVGVNCGNKFHYGITKINALADVENFRGDQKYITEWSYNKTLFASSSAIWDKIGEQGQIHNSTFHKDGMPLEKGEWIVRIWIDGELEQATLFTIE